ncbi:MAG: PHP domain-containing protein [Clostridia bacterium]|nr:PHP domain-containing protein [Clostridia bacterium]
MKKFLLPESGNFYKANLHCHSTWSDGKHSPEELKKLYKEMGYSVLSVTDHRGLFSHYELDDDEFITLTGMELDFDERHGVNYDDCITTHICAIAKDKENFVQPGFDPTYRVPKMKWSVDEEKRALARPFGEPFRDDHWHMYVQYVMKTLRDNGFYVTYNHPTWSFENYPVYMNYTEFDCLEIYNHGCFMSGYDEHNGKVYDDMLRHGRRINCLCADDTHTDRDLFGGFTMLKAQSLTYDNMIDALEKGNFYGSTGPLIDSLWVEDGYLCVRAQTPVEFIRMVSGHRYAGRVASDDGTKVTEARFLIKPDCYYMRLELVDGSRRAYTNAYFTDELLADR